MAVSKTGGRAASRLKPDPKAIGIKKRMRRAAVKAGIAIPKGFRANTPYYGAPVRELARRLNKHYGLKENSLITVALLHKISEAIDPPVNPGRKALAWAMSHSFYEGVRNNRSPEIDAMWRAYRDGGDDFIGSPWCGLYVWASFLEGAGLDLRQVGVAYTPAVTASADRKSVVKDKNGRKYMLMVVPPSKAQAGDIVTFDWDYDGPDSDASVTDHIGIIRAPSVGSTAYTREGNTQAGNSGDQSGHGGSDGTYNRERSFASIERVIRLVPVG